MSKALCERYASYSASHSLNAQQFDKNAIRVVEELESHGFDAFLVGGCLRDALAGLNPKDFDVATNATPEQVAKLLPKARMIGRRFKIAHVRRGGDIIEVTTFRGHGQQASKASGSGRLLRDNHYGNIIEDAERRDFSVNALYYHPETNTLLDFVGAIDDIERRTLRILGDAATRYKEDPVRMIRAVRFAAKLGYDMEDKTHAAIRRMGHHLGEIPPARLFDEVIKLFTGGHAVATWDALLEEQLLEYLLPETLKAYKNDDYSRRFIRLALGNTDKRIMVGKFVAPAFLYAALLWPSRKTLLAWHLSDGMPAHNAQIAAAHGAIEAQLSCTAIPKRFSIPIREIWELQNVLEKRNPAKCADLLINKRFRAAYDFLLLRTSAGEPLEALCDWWTQIQQVNEQEQLNMINALPKQAKRKPRRRRYR